jgi:hypothetical protein
LTAPKVFTHLAESFGFAALLYINKGRFYGKFEWYFRFVRILHLFVFRILAETEISQSRKRQSIGISRAGRFS